MTFVKEGIINIKKPKGYTSHDCVNVVRSLSGIKRVGHTGTLDPMAEGVLPVCIGSAARIAEYLDLDFKTYRCEAIFGLSTDTLDVWGEVVEDNTEYAEKLIVTGEITCEKIQEVLEKFKGLIEQIPPKYSAIKVNGKKLYEYARLGEDVQIATRKVYIKDIVLKNFQQENRIFEFEVVCSKGTYIRSICRDIGDSFGCGASMSSLIRTQSGRFSIEDAVDIEELKELRQGENQIDTDTGRIVKYARALPEDLNKYILDVDFPLDKFGELTVQTNRVKWLCDGGKVHCSQVQILKEPEFKKKVPHIQVRDEFRQAYRAYSLKDGEKKFLGVVFYNEKEKYFKADKIFGRG